MTERDTNTIIKDIDLASNIRNDIEIQYQKDRDNGVNHTLINLMHNYIVPKLDTWSNLQVKDIHSSIMNVPMTTKEYDDLKYVLSAKHLTFPQYARQITDKLAKAKMPKITNHHDGIKPYRQNVKTKYPRNPMVSSILKNVDKELYKFNSDLPKGFYNLRELLVQYHLIIDIVVDDNHLVVYGKTNDINQFRHDFHSYLMKERQYHHVIQFCNKQLKDGEQYL